MRLTLLRESVQQIQSELHNARRSQDEAQSGGGTEPATRAGGDGAEGSRKSASRT